MKCHLLNKVSLITYLAFLISAICLSCICFHSSIIFVQIHMLCPEPMSNNFICLFFMCFLPYEHHNSTENNNYVTHLNLLLQESYIQISAQLMMNKWIHLSVSFSPHTPSSSHLSKPASFSPWGFT